MPTIKKISLNGTTYDLGGGLTEDVKQASLQIAEKVAYIDEHGQDYYDELYTAFYDNMWNVTNTLSNAVNSNTATKTPKDGTYTAIISAATGYTLEGATVSVTMNGANITSSVYNNGTISIPTVTGDVVITVVAVALTVVSISAVYTQSGTVYDTDSLDSLKADLVVTATFNDSSTEVVPSTDYTLSGTLNGTTSVITVSYLEVTTTFNVTVKLTYYLWDFTESLTDQRQGAVFELTGVAERTSDGLVFDSNLTSTAWNADGRAACVERGDRIVISGVTAQPHLMNYNAGTKGTVYGYGNGAIFSIGNIAIFWRGTSDAFAAYQGDWRSLDTQIQTPTYFDGKTIVMDVDPSDGSVKMYADGVLWHTSDIGTVADISSTTGHSLQFGNNTNGQVYRRLVIREVRVYR